MKKSIIFLLFILLGTPYLPAQTEGRLFRFPSMHGNQIIFTYAGDLYGVEKSGGIARKLTSDLGFEMFAKFSPNGKNIAFTGQYDGNTEVYVIPAVGGIPQRLTYTATLNRDDVSDRMGPNNIVMTWRDDSSIVYRSRKKSFNDFKGQLFIAHCQGGLSDEIPLPAGGNCCYSPDKKQLAYNRVFREFRTWKYYKGGMADDIWIYDFPSKKTINITQNDAQDIYPMWKGDCIYFLSDRDRIMNLFSYDTRTHETKKLTFFTDYDIKFPSLGDEGIVFEKGGYIYCYSFNSQKTEKIPIMIADDMLPGRNDLKDASKNINTASVSPDGKRVIFGARGDLYSVPAKSGITKNLTHSSGIHDRNAVWSPDAKTIAYISDAGGEDEIYCISQDGSGQPQQLTHNSDTYKFWLRWSPDGKKILWNDKKLRLQYLDVESQKITLIDTSVDWEFTDFSWSPDSRWICYARPDKSAETKLFVYDTQSQQKKPLTDGWYEASDPSFSSDGRFLFFVSNRDFNPTYSWTEWNHAYVDMSKVYCIPLKKSTPSPFAPENDEVNQTANQEQNKKEENKVGNTMANPVIIDFDGIQGRVISLPIEAASYWNVQAIGDQVYYCKKQKNAEGSTLQMFDLKNKKETELGNDLQFEITADKQKMLLISRNKYSIINLPKSKIETKENINLSNMKTWVNEKEEWKQIYYEAWRQMRDFFYDPNMHGVNWAQIRDKYAPLLPYVNHRADLTYLIGEMIGELNVGHAYVGGGDKPAPKRIKTGLLGAEITKDASGYFKINTILKGENWASGTRSPLTEVGVDVHEGEFIVAVNGISCKEMPDLYASLLNTADQTVELTVNSKPSESGSRKALVVPIADESDLYYYNWVQENIEKVNKATQGQVGYIHIPDMGVEGLNEFVKHFYPQLSKKALIIDDRGNGGGNVSPMIIERLNREVGLMKMARNTAPNAGRLQMQVGPKVCLIDHYSASDGDLFPYQFKKLGIGKLIGVRTWGGVVGIRGSLPFIDGGTLSKPEFAHFDTEGKNWIIEGHGVDPDILIDNDPAQEYQGNDEQLNKAIQYILDELKNHPVELPSIPPFPDKSK